jgi:hypothetical protein
MDITTYSNGFNCYRCNTHVTPSPPPNQPKSIGRKKHMLTIYQTLKNPKEQNNKMLTVYKKYLTINRIN